MSQAKVDKYKKDKANRQKIMRREKRERMAWKFGGYAICLIAVFWIGYSAYSKYYTPPTKTYEVKTDAIDDYLDSLEETETEEAETTEEADTESAEEADTDAAESTEIESEASEEVTETASEASEEATEAASEASEEATEAASEASEEATDAEE